MLTYFINQLWLHMPFGYFPKSSPTYKEWKFFITKGIQKESATNAEGN